MMIGYKLTTQKMTTRNDFQWQLGKQVESTGEGELCGPGWLHYYSHPLLAILHNPIHANIRKPLLFEAEIGGQIKEDRGLKAGCTIMMITKALPVPKITLEQRIRYAIGCASIVYPEKKFLAWSENWLNGKDRSYKAANAYAAYAYAATNAAYAATNAAYADTGAAVAAAKAANAAANAAATNKALDLVKVAKWAISTLDLSKLVCV